MASRTSRTARISRIARAILTARATGGTRASRILRAAATLAGALLLTTAVAFAAQLLLSLGGAAPADTAFAARPPTKTPAPTATPAPTTPPAPTPTTGPTATPTSGCTVNVSTTAGLTTALQNAQPGQIICLAAATYTGRFVATVSGTSASHIVLTGPATAILDGGDNATGYGFHLNGASYWELRGFTVRNSKKGIMTDNASNNLIDGVTVKDIGEEAVHFRTFSRNNTIQNTTITNTGLVTPDFGEGIYIGSANSNWGTYTGGQPDTSDNNRALNNHIGPNVRAENIDIKEGTTGGTISGNYLDATGISGANFADSWIDAKGNGYTISGNTGVNPTHTTILKDGFQVHVAISGWGNNNTFSNNNLDVESTGYGFWVQSGATGTVVCTNNTVTTAASGTANVPLTTC